MHADAADFREPRQAQPLAGHRRQASIHADANEFAQAMRALEEGAGAGERGQRLQLRRVAVAQTDDGESGLRRWDRVGQHHLHADAVLHGPQPRRLADLGRLDERDRAVRRAERRQGALALRRLVRRGGEEAVRRLHAQGVGSVALGEVRLPRSERGPDGPVQRVGLAQTAVPPTVSPAIFRLGCATPTGTLWPFLPQTPTPSSKAKSLPIIVTRVSAEGPSPIRVAPLTGVLIFPSSIRYASVHWNTNLPLVMSTWPPAKPPQ